MSKDNFTIRIAINKPTAPEPIAAKKKSPLPLLAAALLIPALSLGLYQIMKPEKAHIEQLNASATPITSPIALSEPETAGDEANPGLPTNSVSTTSEKRPKKSEAPEALSADIAAQPTPSQILTKRPKASPGNQHGTEANTDHAKTLDEKETDKQTVATQLIDALPPFLQRAQLSMGINKREPQNALSPQVTLSELPEHRLYMFTELRGKSGKTIHHRWLYKNQVMANIPIKVGGDHWRCYSSKRVSENYLGKWVVEITDDQGKVLYTQAFNLKG